MIVNVVVVAVGLCTITVNDAAAALPSLSIAVHLTVVLPNKKMEPEGGSQIGTRRYPYCQLRIHYS
jgi:hypothetical protein